MIRVCAWCKRNLDTDELYATEGEISHGICSKCLLEVTSFERRTTERILDYVNEPIFVIDSQGFIKKANKSGLEVLGKEISEVENELTGDALECSNASRKGGCGKTVHCKTCAIRNIITDTLATGLGYKNIPAFQRINTAEGKKVFKFLLSTEKVDEYILLRIDRITKKKTQPYTTHPN